MVSLLRDNQTALVVVVVVVVIVAPLPAIMDVVVGWDIGRPQRAQRTPTLSGLWPVTQQAGRVEASQNNHHDDDDDMMMMMMMMILSHVLSLHLCNSYLRSTPPSKDLE